ncbi:MAG TPA: hypothetical protein DEV85_01875 [Vibrio sp.]|uniref:Acyltransferase domain-containing protein n=1 Tax=Vibrio casei TaxID=673372 RepID=A0A368LFY2_9VIBR|nr:MULTISPECIES: acyltransferase domain-containing protein [Vibrio]RCS68623.1 acyltransferase domain-containing protein [Vibrio casei]SJN30676.1 Malonyl CoA-acyl carrier protein transacylase [Vibrio casei]HCH00625.1 hypothetical protein [Vibrio sp.]
MFSQHHHVLQWSTPSYTQSLETVRLFEQAQPFQIHALGDIEWTLRHTRKEFAHRCACVIEPSQAVSDALAQPIFSHATVSKTIVSQAAVSQRQCDQLVYVFTGQGSQFSGMAAGIYHSYPVARAMIDQGCAYIERNYGVQLLPLLIEASDDLDEALQNTALAQPALFILAMSYVELLKSAKLSPDTLVGHSLGEFVAACYAGVWNYETALDLIFLRGRLMARAEKGAMIACQLSERELHEALGEDWNQKVDLAAINSGTQLVLSVQSGELAWLLKVLADRSVRHTQLNTSQAYHSRAMEPILQDFSDVVEQSRPNFPRHTWYSNVTGKEVNLQQVTTAQYWCEHLRNTVRFGDAVTNIDREYPNALYFEIGAKPQLSPLMSAVTNTVASIANKPNHSGKGQWLTTLATLWTHGFDIDWQEWCSDEGRRVPLPSIALAPQRYWAEAEVKVLSDSKATQSEEVQASATTKRSGVVSIKAIWSNILGISASELSDDDHFFALGGSSVDLLDVVRQISLRGGQLSVSEAYQCLHFKAMEDKVNGEDSPKTQDKIKQSKTIEPFELSTLSQEEKTVIIEQWKARGENCGNLE